ncbi:SET domain-containing protein [Karstenula rhodostoma CBS 690.94]|uniref:SET domain-containing protein n=1 Tax=Karstenula rhodostoma CBS 690.94 TaxID=1392251 RepID=A0A9P4PMK1_9PLEO|nr:SET domain-containing protein [Karstenula rhodostoma CBS 690.94]
MAPPTTPPHLTSIRPTKEKGRATFAAAPIPAGTLIFSEEPLLSIDATSPTAHACLLASFAALTRPTQSLILDLTARDPSAFRAVVWAEFDMANENTWGDVEHMHSSHAEDVLTAFNTNAVGPHLGLRSATLNHSCAPNAYAAFDEGSGEITLHALRDIGAGEEICISHLEGSALFEAMNLRRGMLVLQRGFVCLCDACMDVEECFGTERESRGEELRAELRALVAKYRRNEATLMANFAKGGHKGVDPEFATFLAEVGAGIVEVVEKLGLATVETLEWYQNVIHWNLALKNEETAKEWQEKILHVLRTCIGEDSLMYREMQQDVNGANASGWEKTTAAFLEISFDGRPEITLADKPEFEDKAEEMVEDVDEESSEEEDNPKDDDYVD